MDAIIRVLLRTVVETVLQRLPQALKRPAKAETSSPPDGGWTKTADSVSDHYPVNSRVIPVQSLPLTTMQTHHAARDEKLSARVLQRRLKDPQSLRQAILINEILNKPVTLRRRESRYSVK